jgi:hypothetical protein
MRWEALRYFPCTPLLGFFATSQPGNGEGRYVRVVVRQGRIYPSSRRERRQAVSTAVRLARELRLRVLLGLGGFLQDQNRRMGIAAQNALFTLLAVSNLAGKFSEIHETNLVTVGGGPVHLVMCRTIPGDHSNGCSQRMSMLYKKHRSVSPVHREAD